MAPLSDTLGLLPWLRLVPAGRLVEAVSKRDYATEPLSALVERSKRGASTVALSVDYDRQSEFSPPDRRAPMELAGRIVALEVRGDGIYGALDWTPVATAKIRDGAYRYLSPRVETASGGVSRIVGASLLNIPPYADPARADGTPVPLRLPLAQIAAAVGLSPNAPEASILARIAGLRDGPGSYADPTRWVPMNLYLAALEARQDAPLPSPKRTTP